MHKNSHIINHIFIIWSNPYYACHVNILNHIKKHNFRITKNTQHNKSYLLVPIYTVEN